MFENVFVLCDKRDSSLLWFLTREIAYSAQNVVFLTKLKPFCSCDVCRFVARATCWPWWLKQSSDVFGMSGVFWLAFFWCHTYILYGDVIVDFGWWWGIL